MGRWGDGEKREKREIFIKRCSAVMGETPMTALHQDRIIILTRY
ncbi:hypothetical protein [Moorena producens]|nr:hypothetical protein [Moorena producens]